MKYAVQTFITTTNQWWTLDEFKSKKEARRYILQRYDDKVEANNESPISAESCAKYISEKFRIKY